MRREVIPRLGLGRIAPAAMSVKRPLRRGARSGVPGGAPGANGDRSADDPDWPDGQRGPLIGRVRAPWVGALSRSLLRSRTRARDLFTRLRIRRLAIVAGAWG